MTNKEYRMNQLIPNQADALVRKVMAARNIPGVTLAIVEHGQIVYARAYGVRNLETQEPLQTESLFHLASVTKLFVATALLQLYERGQLDLEAPVVRYLPYFKLNDPRANEITVRQMMMHTSGMPDTDEYGWDKPEYDDGALERYVRSLADQSLIAEPNEKHFYSNIAYEVLGDVIAKVSGMSFEAFVEQNILRRLGMFKSTLLVQQADPALLSTPHTRDVSGKMIVSPVFPYNRAHAPSSTLYSNVLEMSWFAIACLNHGQLGEVRILRAETVDAMWSPAFVSSSSFWSHVGLTWGIGEQQGSKIVGHGGEDVGFNTSLVLAPARGIGVIALSNCDGAVIEEAADPIMDLMLA